MAFVVQALQLPRLYSQAAAAELALALKIESPA
jgi:hypothetical protein